MRRFLPITGLWLVLGSTAYAQDSIPVNEVPVILSDDPELRAMDSLWVATYLNHFCFSSNPEILNTNNYPEDSVPGIPQAVVQERLKGLDAASPFDLIWNKDVQKMIEFYATRRTEMTSRALGMAELYFPLFEEHLDRYDMPLELRYLPIVESALNAQAKSHAGAVGLWQFMYNTGKLYDLRITSYLDERKDPYKSTEAACRFLTALYDRYGDWNLALAAYNAGPGNVNKAIRRAGGQKDYWAIRPYLPRETRSYVPAFIAVNYIMNHASEHNIYPEEPRFSYWMCDTVLVNQQVRFDQVAAFTNTDEETLEFLNPSYKRGVIPENGAFHVLRLPVEAVGPFVLNQDSIYNWRKDALPAVPEESWITYRVRSGDVLGTIAQRHGVSVGQLKSWNNLRSSMIHPGQRLKIKEKDNRTSQRKASSKPKKSPKPVVETNGAYSYHVVRQGDTLWDIAKLYSNTDVGDIERLNKGINARNLKAGQRIRINKLPS